MPAMPPLNSLISFDAAARHLNFRKAAEELNLTQGAVAQQVRKLEVAVGAQLFRREARGLSLTPPGARYHQEVWEALERIRLATAAVRPDPARIILSVPPSFAAKWLVPRLPEFFKEYPEVELQTIASEEVSPLGPDGIDMAIRQAAPPFGGNIEACFLTGLNLVAVCSPRTADRLDKVLAIEDLAENLLIQDGHNHWESRLGNGRKLKIVQLNQTALAMDTASAGEGLALAPRLLAEDDVRSGKLKIVWKSDSDETVGFYLVHPKKTALQAAGRTVADWLKKHLNPEPGP